MLDKAIQHGKEHRKPYTHAKAVDYSCRNHGSCEYCQGNRHYQWKKWRDSMDEQERELTNSLLDNSSNP